MSGTPSRSRSRSRCGRSDPTLSLPEPGQRQRGARRYLGRVSAPVALAFAVAAAQPGFAAPESSPPSPPLGAGGEVMLYRDGYGVPHVFAEDNYGVYFGYGYAVAEDRLFQMEMLRRTAQGRVSEVLGPDYLSLDRYLRTGYDHRLLARQLAQLEPGELELLSAYADGFNTRLAELRADGWRGLPLAFRHFDFRPEPWTAADVAALFTGSIAQRYADFNSERDNLAFLQAMEARQGKDRAWALFSSVKWLLDADSPTTVPRSGGEVPGEPGRPGYLENLANSEGTVRLLLDEGGKFAGLSDSEGTRSRLRSALAARGFDAHPEFAAASNYWAVTGLDDTAGVMINGPQFGFATPSYVYAIGLHGGDFDVVGNTLLALPCLLFAHNNHLAWGSTAGLSDQTDEFLLRLNPDDPESYWYENEWVPFERWEETIDVRGQKTHVAVARRSRQGMVLEHSPELGVAWARARAWEGHAVDDLMAWIRLSTATTLEEASEVIDDKWTNINMYVMDRDGRQLYVHGGRYPERARGHDPRLPAPGDGHWDWVRLRDARDNPRLVEPRSGVIVNWNNRPAAHWNSSDLWSQTWSPADRVEVLLEALERAGRESAAAIVEVNRLASYQDLNRVYLLPWLEEALDDVDPDPTQADALAALFAWDGQWVEHGAGRFGAAPTIMEAWVRHLLREAFLDDVGDEFFFLFEATQYPTRSQGASVNVPPGIKALVRQHRDLLRGREPAYDLANGESLPALAWKAFALAVRELVGSQGPTVASWSAAAAPMQWAPVNFRGVPQAHPQDAFSLSSYQNRGSENNVFVATGEGFIARDVAPPGQQGHRHDGGSRPQHYGDQMALYGRFGDKALPFSEEAVKKAAESVRVLHPPH